MRNHEKEEVEIFLIVPSSILREVMRMVTWIELLALLALIAEIIHIFINIYLNNKKR